MLKKKYGEHANAVIKKIRVVNALTKFSTFH